MILNFLFLFFLYFIGIYIYLKCFFPFKIYLKHVLIYYYIIYFYQFHYSSFILYQ